MADLSNTRVFGELTVMHKAILKANAEIVGNVTADKFYGDGSNLTGNSDMRARGTTKSDVGLSNIPNSTTKSRDSSTSDSLVTAEGMYDHKRSGDHDSRYYHKDEFRSGTGNSTPVKRDSNGDITARLFASTYDSTNSDIDGIYTTRSIGGDYIRPSTPGQVKNAIGLGNVDNKSQADYDNRYVNKSGNSDVERITFNTDIGTGISIGGEAGAGGYDTVNYVTRSDEVTQYYDLQYVTSVGWRTHNNEDGFTDAMRLNLDTGDLKIKGTFDGDGSNLTGTASLRATETTKSDVGLSNVDNHSRSYYDGRYMRKGASSTTNSTLTISNKLPEIVLNDTTGNKQSIRNQSSVIQVGVEGTYHKLWHAGNDGSGSGLNADKLDGLHEGSFARKTGTDSKFVISNSNYREHLELNRGSLKAQINPSTAGDGELRFETTNIAKSVFDNEVEADKFSGDGSGLTGKAPLRATGTTKDDVGLGKLPNSRTSSRDFDDWNKLLTARGMYNHKRSGDHDDRYKQKGKHLNWGSKQITGYLNDHDEEVNWEAPYGCVVTGAVSVHHNKYEDRRFRYRYRKVKV